MLSHKKYMFWDFNGTILDDLELCHNLLNEMLEEQSRPIVSRARYLDIFTFPIIDYYAKVFDLNETPFTKLATRFIEDYQPRSMHLKLHENVIDVIKYYKKQGIQQILLSASEKMRLMEQLNHYKITDLFDSILGTSDHYAASKLDVAKDFVKKQNIDPNKAVLLGDTLHDGEIADTLKMRCILYTKGHQSKERLKKYQLIDDFKSLIR